MARLSIRLLGSFQVDIEALPPPIFESNKVRALLAYLVLECQRTHNREKLAALFWPEMPSKRANANLSQALYTLRRVVNDHQAEPPYFRRTRETVQFNPDSNTWLDVDAFNAQLAESSTWEATQLDKIQAAVDLYRGDFLEGLIFDSSLAFDEWVLVQRHRLRRKVLQSLAYLVETYAAQGEVAKAIPYAWRQVELDPLEESAYRQLMHLLAAAGQRNQALAQFKRLQILLAEELNVPPEAETVALYERIRSEEHTPVQDKPKGDNLPAFLTPLVGRQTELTEIQAYCENPDCRLLTILGPGGSGKTRLGLEVARLERKTFPHGVFFVPLNPVQAPESILPAIAEALGLPRGGQDDRQTQLTNYLREKNLLLLLDGFEHLMTGAGLIAEILRQAAGVKILATSRTRLNIKGEQVYFLGGMRYPDMAAAEVEIREADAVQLLIAGLRRTRPEYEPAADELSHLLRVCHQVQGMPLSLLLATSWGATLGIEEIAGMVSQNLDFLSADWADVPARQRSLRSTFDHTWNLLSEREQNIFQGLSVFRGAFTRQAAQAVSDASPHELRNLMERSLVWSKTPGWYEVHELLRQYGREKLALVDQVEQEVCDKHSAYYLGQLSRLGDELKSAQQVTALGNIDLEHENYRAAWNWSASRGKAAQVSQALDALCMYYELSLRYSDGESACRAAIEGLSQGENEVDFWPLTTRLLTWQGRFMRLLGQPEAACRLLDQAHANLEKACAAGAQARAVEAFLTLEHGNYHFDHDRAAATTCYKYSLRLYRMVEDTWGTAKALSRLGFAAHHAGNFKKAVEIYSQCLHLNRNLGDPRGIADALIELGQNSLRQGLAAQGEQYINEGVSVLQQIGDQAGAARGYFELARYLFWSGDSARCLPLVERSSQIFEFLGMLDKYIFASIGIGLGLSHVGQYEETITRVVKNLPLAQKLGAYREIGLANVILGMAYLGQRDFEAAESSALKSVKQYREINQQEELSLALAILVYTHLGRNQTQQAGRYLCKILQIGIDIHGVYPILYILYAASLILIECGKIEMALEVAALAERYPFVGNSRWFEDLAGLEIARAAETLPREVVTTAQERGRARDLWETAAELLKELSETSV
jgi:DNA-binding SARP family transcriptional activator